MHKLAIAAFCHILFFFIGITPVLAEESNHFAARYHSQTSCSQAIDTVLPDAYSEYLDGDEISLLSWNIEKGKNSGWKAELEKLTQGINLALLQEAVFIDEMKESSTNAIYWSFSPGYQTKGYNSGVMTLSQVRPDLFCTLQQQEPWLQSPKLASITRYKLKDNSQALLLVNIHQINFTLGIKAFSRQLEEVINVLSAHAGPIIFSGDFNTWRKSRMELLSLMTAELGLSPASFSPDFRKTAFGHPLDHIFTRGFEITESHTLEVNTSDHNPLFITLSLKEA